MLSQFISEGSTLPRQTKLAFLGFFWLLLMLIPLCLYLNTIEMFPLLDLKGTIAQGFYWITWTGTTPYGIGFILFILAICFSLIPRKIFIHLFLAVGLSQVVGLVLNHELKDHFHEHRPYVQWFEQQQQLNSDFFYLQSKPHKQAMVKQAIAENFRTLPMSDRISEHWQREVGYAFPSGHTQFAVSFALIVSFYLLSAGFVSMPILMTFWAILMGFSRMFLGLHWPQDVLGSSFIGGLLAFASIAIIQWLAPKIGHKYPKRYG